MSAAPDSKRRSRFRGKGMDPPELARAEENLRNTGDAELSPEWIDATVARVTGAKAARRRFRFVSRVSLPAAVLLASLLMLAAVTVLWPERRNSPTTMSYAMAVAILERTDQPVKSQKAALATVSGRVAFAIDTIQQVHARSDLDPELIAAAASHLVTLKQIVATGTSRRSGPVDEDLADAGRDVLLDTQPKERRLLLLDYLGSSACSGVIAVLEMANSTPVLVDREIVIKALRRQLGLRGRT